MNWFDILKEQASVQSSRSGMAPIDIQKPFKRVKEDKDCFEKLKEYLIDLSKMWKHTTTILDENPDRLSIGFDIPGPKGGDMINGWIWLQKRHFLEDFHYCQLLADLKDEPQLEMIMKYAFENDFVWRDWSFMSGFYLKASHKDYGRSNADGTKSQIGVIRGTGDYNAKIVYGNNPMEVIRFSWSVLDDESNNEDTQKAAGAVISTTPGIHNIRYSRRKKRGKKERED